MGIQNRLRYSSRFNSFKIYIFERYYTECWMFKQDPDERKYQICTKLELEILCETIRQIEGDSALSSQNVHMLSRIFVLIWNTEYFDGTQNLSSSKIFRSISTWTQG